MLQLIETICWEKGGFQRLSLHEERMFLSAARFFGQACPIHLSSLLEIPPSLQDHKVKCRVTYSDKIENIQYETYLKRSVKSLKLVYDDAIDYSFKFRDRTALNRLFGFRGESDDILIVKNGLITDTSYANIVFLKNGEWFTPELPLLRGTRREEYLRTGLIRTGSIRPEDLSHFEEARLINAMLSLEEGDPVRISDIYR